MTAMRAAYELKADRVSYINNDSKMLKVAYTRRWVAATSKSSAKQSASDWTWAPTSTSSEMSATSTLQDGIGLLYFAHVTGFKKYIVERMVEMKGLLHDVMSRQKDTNLRLDQMIKHGAASVQELPADVEFPLATVADVDNLEAKLIDLRLQESIASVSLNTCRSV